MKPMYPLCEVQLEILQDIDLIIHHLGMVIVHLDSIENHSSLPNSVEKLFI